MFSAPPTISSLPDSSRTTRSAAPSQPSTTSSRSQHTTPTSSSSRRRRDSPPAFQQSTPICKNAAGASNASTCSSKVSQFNSSPLLASLKKQSAKLASSRTKVSRQKSSGRNTS